MLKPMRLLLVEDDVMVASGIKLGLAIADEIAGVHRAYL